MIIQTVEGIQRNFTKREKEQAEEARRLYVINWRPSQKFENMLKKGKLMSSTITIRDYRNALQINDMALGVF